jgi:hypothetical protein
MGIMETEEFPYGQMELSAPTGSKVKEMSITFYDDQNRTLLRWIKDWIELDIQNKGQFISGLGDAHQTVAPDMEGRTRKVVPVRTIKLALLEAYKKEMFAYTYGIFPTGEISYEGSHESEATQYTVTFKIVEDLTKKVKAGSGFGFDDVKGLLGRFI